MWVTVHHRVIKFSFFSTITNCRAAHGWDWLKLERVGWIKATTKWRQGPSPSHDWWRWRHTVYLLKLLQMLGGFYGRLELGQRLNPLTVNKWSLRFYCAGERKRECRSTSSHRSTPPPAQTHTHTVTRTEHPSKNDEEGMDCGHIYRKT